MPLLPQEVQQQGVSVEKSSSSFLMVAGFISEDGTMQQEDIADYVGSNIKDPISRTPGVGDVQLFGSQYAMRIWMDPHKLNNYKLTPVDVINAIKIQNNQVAAGQLGDTTSTRSGIELINHCTNPFDQCRRVQPDITESEYRRVASSLERCGYR